MERSCCVPFCSGKSGDGLNYHEIPSNLETREKWLKVLYHISQCNDMSPNEINKPESRSAVCSLHFVERDYILSNKQRRLKPDAVPSIFRMRRSFEISAVKRAREAPNIKTESNVAKKVKADTDAHLENKDVNVDDLQQSNELQNEANCKNQRLYESHVEILKMEKNKENVKAGTDTHLNNQDVNMDDLQQPNQPQNEPNYKNQRLYEAHAEILELEKNMLSQRERLHSLYCTNCKKGNSCKIDHLQQPNQSQNEPLCKDKFYDENNAKLLEMETKILTLKALLNTRICAERQKENDCHMDHLKQPNLPQNESHCKNQLSNEANADVNAFELVTKILGLETPINNSIAERQKNNGCHMDHLRQPNLPQNKPHCKNQFLNKADANVLGLETKILVLKTPINVRTYAGRQKKKTANTDQLQQPNLLQNEPHCKNQLLNEVNANANVSGLEKDILSLKARINALLDADSKKNILIADMERRIASLEQNSKLEFVLEMVKRDAEKGELKALVLQQLLAAYRKKQF